MKNIFLFENYCVDEYGNVFRQKKYGELKQIAHTIAAGYKRVGLYQRGKRTFLLVHRIVAKTFHPLSEFAGAEVNHKDGNKLNNFYQNLEWATRRDNNIHAIKLGLKKMNGENHSQNKLTEEMVLEIRYRNLIGQNYVQIAKDYPVCKGTIGDIVRRRSWAHI